MKNSISSLFLLFAHLVSAQISFEGAAEPLSYLNSPNGQNYLVLDPNSNKMAITEERAGNGDQQDLVNYSDSTRLFIFQDWLQVKGMVSPLGFEGDDLLYSHVFFDKGVYYGLIMRLLSDGGERLPVTIPFFNNKSTIQSGHLSSDQNYMIISAESNNTKGVEDLYVSKRKPDGGWSSMTNLSRALNSEYQEITPFLAADNKTLFFASNRPGGSGSFDIYYATRLDDSWRSWTDPTPLGNQINTKGAETSFSFRDDEGWAYFVRSEDSDGYGDVFKIKMTEEIDADTTASSSSQSQAVSNEVPVDESYVLFKVVDARNGNGIPAVLIASMESRSDSQGVFRLGVEDLFRMGIDSGSQVEFKAEGYLSRLLDIKGKMHLETSIALSSIAKGETIQLQHVLFHRGTADLVSGSEKELDLVVEVLNDNPKIKILLKGHTDSTGDPVRNVRLSEARVKSVKEYLVSQGISAYRVSGKGFGGNQPIASNENEETRRLNRRVEFEVVEN